MGIACCEMAIRVREAWFILDRVEEIGDCLIEAPAEEKRASDYR
jgi:hypothetical protein